MPGPKTHDISYKLLKKRLSHQTLSSLPNYDDYRIFAQGHDFFIYYNFYKIRTTRKLNEQIASSTLLQEYYFPNFIYNYLKAAERRGCLYNEEIRLFLEPGYILHHILDAYMHPFIIYYSGDHTRDVNKKTWYHGIMENLLDIYFMRKYENFDYVTPVNGHFSFDSLKFSEDLVAILNDSLLMTYGINNGGYIFKTSVGQVKLYIRAFKDDRYALKRSFFDLVDQIFKGTSSFSYNRDETPIISELNLQHEIWQNPMDSNIVSTSSLLDLFEEAITVGSQIIEKLEKLIQSGNITKEGIDAIIPNIASTHGLVGNQKIIIRNVKRS